MRRRIIKTKFAAYLVVLFLVAAFAVFLYLLFIYFPNNFQSTLDTISQTKNITSGCREKINGQIEIKNPMPDSSVLLNLSYSAGGNLAEKSVLVEGNRYTISVFGKPDLGAIWSLTAYYFDKNGQISESANDISGILCDQKINLDFSL